MAEFDVETPTGHVLSIEAPDEETAIAGARDWHYQNSTLSENIKSFPSGLGRGFVKGLSEYGAALAPLTAHEMSQPELAKEIPSGEETFKQIQKNVTGELPPPVTTGGRLGEKAGEFAAFMGPMEPVTSIPAAAGLAAKSTLAAGGGMLGKNIAEGTPYEIPAEIAGTMVAPGSAAWATEKALKGTGRIIGGVATGAGQEVPRQAFEAGAAGGKEWDTFVKNMRTQIPPETIAEEGNRAIGNLFRSRSANYEAGVKQLEKTPHYVGFDGADKGLAEVADIGKIRGIVTRPELEDVRNDLTSVVNQWKGMAQQDPYVASEKGIHDLKKAVESIRDRYNPETQGAQYHIADRVYHSIQDSISKVSPRYEKMTSDWASASQELKQLQRTFSLRGPDTNTDTALRKLLSVARDEANTNYGARANLATILEQNGAPNIGAAVAGQASKAWLPRGLARLGSELIGGAGIGAAGMTIHPGTLAMLPLLAATSPRVVGEAAGGLGRMAGYLGLPEGFQTAKSKEQMIKNLAAALMAQGTQQKNPLLAKSLMGQQ